MMINSKEFKRKRTNLPRDAKKTDEFLKDWERLSRSGRHNMNILKEAMMLLIANDEPLPPEWKDHKLNGNFQDFRECHVKGDLLLVYHVEKIHGGEVMIFFRVGTHSELF